MSSSNPHSSETVMTEMGPMTDHAYDGIREYDNPLPGWWKWLFVGSIVFSLLYFPYYHSGATGRAIADNYEAEAAANTRLQFGSIGELKGDEATILQYMEDPKWLRVGQSVFKNNCGTCHGLDGGGMVGPNLCDDHYKNVRNVADIYTVLSNGAAAGAMPAWKTRMHINELVLTSSYVASLRGTKPAKPKDPDGQIIPPWPPAPPKEAPASETDGEGKSKANGAEAPKSEAKPAK